MFPLWEHLYPLIISHACTSDPSYCCPEVRISEPSYSTPEAPADFTITLSSNVDERVTVTVLREKLTPSSRPSFIQFRL